MGWFLYDNGLRHESVKLRHTMTEIVKRRISQNTFLGLRDHTIESINSFWFWISLITLSVWLAVVTFTVPILFCYQAISPTLTFFLQNGQMDLYIWYCNITTSKVLTRYFNSAFISHSKANNMHLNLWVISNFPWDFEILGWCPWVQSYLIGRRCLFSLGWPPF